MSWYALPLLFLIPSFLQAEEIELVPFSPSSKWQPIPAELEAGRSGDQIILRTSQKNLLGISQNCATDGPGIMLRIDSVTGPPGSKAAVSLRDRVAVPYIAGTTLFVDTEGVIDVSYEFWENARLSIPDEPMTFPFWVQISWSGGGFGCYLSQDRINWMATVLTAITFPPASYDLMVQTSEAGEEACATISEVALLGADANDNGMTDGWEIQNFERVLALEDSDDPDQDGRNNLQEWLDHTDPNSPDKPATQLLKKVGDQFQLTLSKAIYSGLSLEMSSDLKTWETVSRTMFDLKRDYSQDTSTFEIDAEENDCLFFRTRYSPAPDRDSFDLLPAIWE